MTPTRQEIKAAIEWALEAAFWQPKKAAVLRAMLETFDEREDFMEAAMEECPQCGGRGYIEVYDGEVLCHVCGGSRP